MANVHHEVSVESTGQWPLTWSVATCGSHCAHKDTKKHKDTRKHNYAWKQKDTRKHKDTKKHIDTGKHKDKGNTKTQRNTKTQGNTKTLGNRQKERHNIYKHRDRETKKTYLHEPSWKCGPVTAILGTKVYYLCLLIPLCKSRQKHSDSLTLKHTMTGNNRKTITVTMTLSTTSATVHKQRPTQTNTQRHKQTNC